MAVKYVSGRVKQLNVGITSYSEDKVSLEVAGLSTFKGSVGLGSNLNVSGVSTFAGIVTTSSDLYVGGDLYVADDIVLDEVVLRNINVTGISTLGIASASTLNVVGISTFGTINATGVSTFSSSVSFGSSAIFGDNDKILLGDGADLQIFHDSLNSYITDAGTGDLKLTGAGNIALENSTLGTNSAVFDTTGGIDFYWGGAGAGKRLEIAGYGATITGDLYLSGDLFTGGEGQIGEDITTRNLDVIGISTLRGDLSVAGVSTFTGAIDANGNLDVDGHTELDDVNVSGAITATTFTGNLTGTVNTAAQPNITSLGTLTGLDVNGHVETDTLKVSGLSTFVGDAKFEGNVSIAGTLTKEDVTNIDSVGIVTAGKGLRVTTGGIVVTAGISTFGAISTFTSNVFVDGTLTGAGIATFTQNVFVDGTLTGAGIATFAQNVFVDGTLTAGLIDGGSY